MLSRNKLSHYRNLLNRLAERHRADLARLRRETAHPMGGEASGGISNLPASQADLGLTYHQEEVGLLLGENQEWLLAECEAALNRIDAGTYGLCERCGRQIPPGRLEAFPSARYCVACAEKMEEEESLGRRGMP
jgi:RNA polymerase-binding transcription factor DksA